MKLLRVGDRGAERPALLDYEGHIRDLSSVVNDIDGSCFGKLDELRSLGVSQLPIVDPGVRIGACVGNVGKFICIGLNYADHAAEAGAAVPEEPIVFFKSTSAIAGPNDELVIPKNSLCTDWEVELGVVVGRRLSYADEPEAAAAIAGYCVINDLSERNWQLHRGGQWVKGKSADGFGPIGPYLVTSDDVQDPDNLKMWLTVDGQQFQKGSTSTMIFKPPFLLSYLSQFMSLQPGDIVSTGTPPGVGLGQKPPRYLRPGQTIRLGIEGLGEQIQRTRAWSEQ